jgi:hypothetical protein
MVWKPPPRTGSSTALKRVCVLSTALVLLLGGCGGGGGQPPGKDEHIGRGEWGTVAADPDAHVGANVDLIGRVVLAPSLTETHGVLFGILVDNNKNHSALVQYMRPIDLSKDDFVEVRGSIKEMVSGNESLGLERAPLIAAENVRKVPDPTPRVVRKAPGPTARVLPGGKPFLQRGVTLYVDKVEIGPKQTRAYVRLRNGSRFKLLLHASDATFLVPGKRYAAKFSSRYPRLDSELAPGEETSGVILFSAVTTRARYYLFHFEASFANRGRFGWDISWG